MTVCSWRSPTLERHVCRQPAGMSRSETNSQCRITALLPSPIIIIIINVLIHITIIVIPFVILLNQRNLRPENFAPEKCEIL